jgi:predicted methyltransferase
MPVELKGTADAVLFIRALHNLARFEEEGGYLTAALQDAFDVLKPGGTVGVVQHRARDTKSDEWAGGQRGYLKMSFVIAKMEEAGFEFEGGIEINMNEKDQPGEEDIVWRLPPSFATSHENPELKAEMEAIGESNRMTLKFRKP